MLLETLVAMSLIAVVMAALTTFFVNAVASTGAQRATQVATQIANSTVDMIRALPSSDPLNGRDSGTVSTQFAAASSTVTPWLATMTAANDPNALPGAGATAAVPTVGVPQTLNNIVYTVNVYLGTCVIPSGKTTAALCNSGPAGSGIGYLRAVVAVTWPGTRCPPTKCTYVTSTLLSTIDDPLYNLNQSPPAAPVLTNPGDQVNAVGDTVALTLAVSAVPTSRIAITSGTLPIGLVLDTAAGRISGVPNAVSPATPVTLTLTDGFGRASTATFSWTVGPALSATTPPAQSGVVGTAITPLTLAASGGTAPYVWSDTSPASLPAGLALSVANGQTTVTGTPTTVGTFRVTLTATDAKGRTAGIAFTWTVDYPPFAAANPGPQTSTLGVPDSLALTVTGGSGSFAWTGGSTLPAGLTLTPAGVISGTPTTAGASTVALVATDTKTSTARSISFSWTVYARPTVGSPGDQSVTVGLAVQLQLATTCPNAPCTYSLNNGPATLSINGAGLVSGTVTSAAQVFDAVTITVTDKDGAVVSTPRFAVTVNAQPTITDPGNRSTASGAPDSLDVAALVTGGTSPLTYSAANLPSWLTLNPSTGLISGTAPNAVTNSGITVTVRDSFGFSATSAPFSWTVVARAPSAPGNVAVVNGDGSVTVSWSASAANGSTISGYTVRLTPGGGSCTTTALTCTVSGLVNGSASSITVTATNGVGQGPASAAVIGIPYPAGVMAAANGMTLWLDGSDASTVVAGSCTGATSTSLVACWKDKSGAANNFTQTVSANQPAVGTWNGLPAVTLADSGDVMTAVGKAQYQTVFVAANVQNAAGNVIINLFGRATEDFNVRIGTPTQRNNPNGNDWSYNTGSPPANFNNGAQATTVNQPLPVVTSDQAATVQTMTASVSNTFLNRGVIGQIGDVITFNKTLSAPQRRAVESYLANKWGVPQAPFAVTAAVASTTSALVSWTAPSGGGPVSGYTVTSSPGGKTCTTTGLSCTVAGLTHSTSYTFVVTPSPGPASSASNAVTP